MDSKTIQLGTSHETNKNIISLKDRHVVNHGHQMQAVEIQRMGSNQRMFFWMSILSLIPITALFGGTWMYFLSQGHGHTPDSPLHFLRMFNFGDSFDPPSESTNFLQMTRSKIGIDFDDDDYDDEADDEFQRERSRELMSRTEFTNYENALRVRASRDKVILIKMLNEKAADMAINFSEEILTKKGYENYLFVSMEKEVCDALKHVELPCYVHDDYEGGQVTREQLVDYLRPGQAMALLRVRMILDAITLGYTVLFTGANTLYLKDPFGVMESTCGGNCDVTVSIEPNRAPYANWVAHYIRPTRSSVLLYSKVLLDLKKQVGDSQSVLNSQLKELHDKIGLKVEALDSSKFLPASVYFQTARFADDNPCGHCVAVYEDRGISRAEHLYQLKEMGLWRANFDEYYTSRKRGYIRYHHPYNFQSNTRALINEVIALRNALVLGQMLDKIVILPRFHCPEGVEVKTFCSLHDILKITDFDEQFGGLYREHTFPNHPEVSREVKRQVSDVYFIGSKHPPKPDDDSDLADKERLVYLSPADPDMGATADELKEFFSQEWRYFLRIHSLYGGLKGFDTQKETDKFNKKLGSGFKLRRSVQQELEDKGIDITLKYVK